MKVAIIGILLVAGLAGCVQDGPVTEESMDQAPYLGYQVPEPDMALDLLEQSFMLTGEGGVDIYVRIVRPDTDEPVPVITQFTPYTAPGQNAMLDTLIEPAVPNNLGNFDTQFARRGFAFAYADVRGTGDSSGCLDLRGQLDIADAWHLTEFLGTQEWSNGKVGFIGASYPGSEAHMAGLANNEHLGAVIPVVASTSFYHYHHNDGVPYFANHLATNSGYTSEGITPTLNPTSSGAKMADQPLCPHAENAVMHGAADQTGDYYEWWQERNLRGRAAEVQVPVLMAQGLADWNVKPDHIATWFNDLAPNASKTLIAGQWGHQYPRDAEDAYGDWWPYAAAFFDTFLKGVETGMFEQDTAWVQDNTGVWHRSSNWPLLPDERDELSFVLMPDNVMRHADQAEAVSGEVAWYGCPEFGPLGGNMVVPGRCDTGGLPEEITFTSHPFTEATLVSGVPLLHLNVRSDVDFTHLIAVMQHLDASGAVIEGRENYGYLNPTYRNGIEDPQPVPVGEVYNVTIDFYPQEDLFEAGDQIRLVIRSNDSGSISAYAEGANAIVWEEPLTNSLWLPLRPADLQGVRLGAATE